MSFTEELKNGVATLFALSWFAAWALIFVAAVLWAIGFLL